MFRKLSRAFAISGLTLALAACGSSDEVVTNEVETEPEIALSTIQEVNFERFNRDEFFANLEVLQQEPAEIDGAADFAALDQNDSGKLDVAEYALIGGATVSAEDKEASDKVIRSFFALDSDGDSSLSEEEFVAAGGLDGEEGGEDIAAGEGNTSES
ncbi:MAG: hypothetical protein KUG65_03610 [Sphingomonadaceae bacterium]|nr:hypothetical protein [Sphingomonadaceae bacterium]